MAIGSARAATLVERESGIRIRLSAATVLYWQNAPRYPTKSGVVRFKHTDGRPRRQARQRPHPGDVFPTTRSPGVQPESLGAAATMPDHSCPRMAPGLAYRSNTIWRSEPQMPHSAISTSTSPVPGSGHGTCSTATLPSPT